MGMCWWMVISSHSGGAAFNSASSCWTFKSYDAVTGLVGNDLRLGALKAVVAQEPVWNMYNYLFSNGASYILSPSALNSLYQVPSVQSQINAAARHYVPNSVRANLASGQPVSPWDPPVPGQPNTILANQGFPPRPSWIRALARPAIIDTIASAIFGPTLGPGAASIADRLIPEAPSTNQLDWFLSLAHFDYRIWTGQLNGSTITFQFEVSKYYDNGKSFLNLSTQDFELLINEGLARNFWIAGISNAISIPAG